MSPKSSIVQRHNMHNTDASESELPWDLLDRFYSNEVTEDERKQVEAFLNADVSSMQVMAQINSELSGDVSPEPVKSPNTSSMLAALHERMQPKAAIKRLVHTCFGGSVERAVAALLDVEDTELTDEEIKRLRSAIETAKQEGR